MYWLQLTVYHQTILNLSIACPNNSGGRSHDPPAESKFRYVKLFSHIDELFSGLNYLLLLYIFN